MSVCKYPCLRQAGERNSLGSVYVKTSSGETHFRDHTLADFVRRSSLQRAKAEGTGFEPVPPLRENGFRDRRFEPLSQPSLKNLCADFSG